MAYTEGQLLMGSDGKPYVVRNGVPVLDAPAGGMLITKPVTQKDAAETTSAAQRAADAVAASPYRQQSAADDFQIKHSQAIDAKAKSDNVEATARMATMAPNSNLHGEAYFNAINLPENERVLARAYARGDLGSRAGGITTSMLPIIQHAMNYDPTTSATTFPARVKMQQDLAGNQPNTLGGGIRAMEQMLFHGRDVLHNGAALANYGPGLIGSLGNKLKVGYEGMADDPRLAAYNQSVNNYAPESQKGVAGAAGVGAERQERHDAYAPSLSQPSRAAALQADATMAFDRTGAVNDQYKRLMGKDIVDLLSPDAKKAYDEIMSGGYDAKGKALHPATGYVQGSVFGSSGPGGASGGDPGGPPPPVGPIATGGTKAQSDPAREKALDAMLRSGADFQTINSVNKQMGGTDLDQQSVESMRDAVNKGYKGPTFDSSIEVPSTLMNRVSASPMATGIVSGTNAAMGGLPGALSGMTPQIQAMAALNPGSAALGDTVGSFAGAAGFEGLLGKVAGNVAARYGAGAASRALANPYVADTAFGAATGASADTDHPLMGALGGGLLGAGGSVVGRKVLAPAVSGMFGGAARMMGRPLTSPSPLNAGESAVMSAAQKTGTDSINSALSEAQRLGVPMSLADTGPAMDSLAGAAVRRSPTASQVAQNTLLPRARGQIDRLGNAVETNLGPVGNIPQISADLSQQAKTAAGPLYDKAYASPVISTPELDATLNTPFGRDALGRARTIAANERRSPTELGFAQDAQGNTILNPMPNQAIAAHLDARNELDLAQAAYRDAKGQPGTMDAARARVGQARDNVRQTQSALGQAPDPAVAASVPGYTTQTLDYVKRGMDDVLEQQRNPMTGRLVLDEAGRAQNGLKNQFLSEVDRLNPDYAAARAAFAGPSQARDAMSSGMDAFSANPNQLGVDVSGATPERMAQMQLGYRGALMDNANRMRLSSNPFDATLGTPAAEQRLATMYPNNPGNADLLRTRDLEGGLARTNNKILGNSETAARQLSDQAFGGGALPAAALDVGMMAMGGAPTASIGRAVASGGIRDAMTMGLGKRAVSKADAIAPLMFNTDPTASAASLSDLLARNDAYRNYVNNRATTRIGGMFGAGAGAGLSSYLLAQGN